METIPKYIRTKTWRRNPADPKGTKEGVPNFLRVLGWRLNPAWVPTLKTIIILDYIEGGVVPVRKVPKALRPQYHDTLARFALACYRAGYGPGTQKGKRRVNSTYRDPAEQAVLYALNMIAPGIPKPGRPLTSLPGTSPHNKGIALDVPNVRDERGLLAECRKLGLHDDVPSEKWHLTNHNVVAS
ncbi:MAG: D-alanyl-D-alanine carboxypeptidase family protein [Polaromonas sp.]|nr:D-alanyl-D-alanine carboxypeptidase family protein [Gemmatimonadaceae bacterium]